MITAKQLHAPYRYVISENLVSTAVRLLSIAGPETTINSMVLSGELKPKLSLMNLEGLGKEIWAGEDAQDYVSQLRGEWSND